MPAHRVAFLDVFAERPLAGNGLAVVDDADALTDEVMLAFAKETRLAETTFLQSPAGGEADYRTRIWTPGEELPFAGHPSLGTAVAVARWRDADEASFTQQTGAGLQPVEVRAEGAAWRASMLQAETSFGAELASGQAMSALGLDPHDAHPELAPQMVSTGIFHAIVPLAEISSLGRIEPDYPAIDALIGPHDGVCLYAVCRDSESGEARARAFSRVIELGEDPATGSAAGPLCAYLQRHGDRDAVTVRQGEEMGRPAVLEAEIDPASGRVRVSGAVVPLIDGTVELPA